MVSGLGTKSAKEGKWIVQMAALRGTNWIRKEGKVDRNTALEREGCNSEAASI